MHPTCYNWIKGIVERHNLSASERVLEVGSLDVNGSARDFFAGNYFGIDRVEGKGVDAVCDAHKLSDLVSTSAFDVVVCTEVLEHDEFFWITLDEISKVLKPNGYLILTARGDGFPQHDYPHDFYRFMPDSIPMLAALAGCKVIEHEIDETPGILLLGKKI